MRPRFCEVICKVFLSDMELGWMTNSPLIDFYSFRQSLETMRSAIKDGNRRQDKSQGIAGQLFSLAHESHNIEVNWEILQKGN